jgi:hypothetical protein
MQFVALFDPAVGDAASTARAGLVIAHRDRLSHR